MAKKNDLIDMTSSFQNPDLKNEIAELQNLNPTEKSMLAILDLFHKQVYRGQELARVRDAALDKLNDMVETDQLSARELIETVRVTSEMEVHNAKSVFDLVKPSGANGINIFMNPESVSGLPIPVQDTTGTGEKKSGAQAALENKKMAAFAAFMEAVEKTDSKE